MDSNKKKAEQLGMPQGTAQNRLRKMILFDILVKSCKATCHQCGNQIYDIDDFSIEHKIPWLDSEDPIKLFFDLDNIAFSHLSCNARAGRKKQFGPLIHGTLTAYGRNCRCEQCKVAKRDENKRNRKW